MPLIDILHQLQTILPHEAILVSEPMTNHTSFKIGGPADYLLLPDTIDQLTKLILLASQRDIPYMLIGNGSNLLVRDGGLRGLVIKTSHLTHYSIEQSKLTADCGLLLENAAQVACEQSLQGLEFASGIPGTIGGAVIMNAGAYGGEMKDVVTSTEYLLSDGSTRTLYGEEHQFGYRTSFLQQHHAIVLRTTLQLSHADPISIKARMDDLHEQRWSKQPMDMPSAGSIFKRPEGHFTGQLIDACGLRGFQIGGAKVSDKHCGFIVNAGHATAKDVLNLISHIQFTVMQEHGVKLETEVRIVGEDPILDLHPAK